MTLKFYGDESADETRSRVFAVAAVYGAEVEWADLMPKWLRRTRGLPFHAATCESEFVRHPDPQKHKDNLALYRDLTTILAESWICGRAVSLDLQSQREYLPDLLPDFAYFNCFAALIDMAGRTTEKFNAAPTEGDQVRMEFTFDSRLESDGAAGIAYTAFRTLPEWKDASIFDTKVSFDSGDPRLEVADLFAREAMKELDRKITNARPEPRRSYQALMGARDGGQFKFTERDREYCQKWRDRVHAPESQADLRDYREWLIRTGRVQNGHPVDNIVNRTLYFAWSEHQRAFMRRRGDDSSAAS